MLLTTTLILVSYPRNLTSLYCHVVENIAQCFHLIAKLTWVALMKPELVSQYLHQYSVPKLKQSTLTHAQNLNPQPNAIQMLCAEDTQAIALRFLMLYLQRYNPHNSPIVGRQTTTTTEGDAPASALASP